MRNSGEIRIRWGRRTFVVLLPMMISLVAGCGDGRPSRVPISGRVLVDGKPLDYGNIRFHPQGYRPASAKINPDGTFTMSTYEYDDGVVTGQHLISVNASKLLNPRTVRWLAPKKYANVTTSELTYNVTEPTDNANIELTWSGGKPFDERIQGGGRLDRKSGTWNKAAPGTGRQVSAHKAD